MAGMVITIFFAVVALVGLVYLPHDPLQPVGPDYAPPSMKYPFGTTFVGQDVFSQWIYGARSTLLVGFLSALIAMGIGIVIGITAGYISLSDEPLMRFTDVILTLPALPMLITIAAFVRPTIVLTAALIAFLSWPATARVTRSDVLSLRESPYVEVARLSGVPARYIMFRDMLRHILPLVLALALFSVIGAILTEASLDFIGVGPSSAFTWGAMISFANDANAAFVGAWWWFLIPGLSIALLSTGLAFIAYGVETVLKEA
jgi:peptide/nickel transport system permease protein